MTDEQGLIEDAPVEADRIYPCADCGAMRSKAEGGTTFTVCDACWDKAYPRADAHSSDAVPQHDEGIAEQIQRETPETLRRDASHPDSCGISEHCQNNGCHLNA